MKQKTKAQSFVFCSTNTHTTYSDPALQLDLRN